MILAGDVGGTKVHLAIFEEGKKLAVLRQKLFSSEDFEDFSLILQDFFSSFPGFKIQKACLGIAGPVVNETCSTTNLPWKISAKQLRDQLKTDDVWLINDLEANAWGLHCLNAREFLVLNEGVANIGNEALISVGTGLGEAGLFWDGKEHHPFSSEGGHCSFAPQSEEEMELWRFMRKKREHVSFEHLLSGRGIYAIYLFLVDVEKERENEQIKQAKEPQKIITQLALQKKCPLCEKTLEIFSAIYGSESGNLALKMMAVSGVYVGGGIAPKIVPFLREGKFMKAFQNKGRFASLLEKIPVKVVLNDNTALFGAASYAEREQK